MESISCQKEKGYESIKQWKLLYKRLRYVEATDYELIKNEYEIL